MIGLGSDKNGAAGILWIPLLHQQHQMLRACGSDCIRGVHESLTMAVAPWPVLTDIICDIRCRKGKGDWQADGWKILFADMFYQGRGLAQGTSNQGPAIVPGHPVVWSGWKKPWWRVLSIFGSWAVEGGSEKLYNPPRRLPSAQHCCSYS